MDATEMPDTRVNSKCYTYYKTGSGGLAWPCRCRRQLATANDVSNMKTPMPKHQCNPSLPLLLWSYYTDFMSIEMTMELGILVFCNHFTEHMMAYVTPNQTVNAVARFLWQGYISIFGAPAKLLSD